MKIITRSRFLACAFGLVIVAACGIALPQTPAKPNSTPPPEARVDINSASLDQLLNIPGMTRTWAERIIRFRPYRIKSDLVDRGVVTNGVYNRIKDYIIAHRTK